MSTPPRDHELQFSNPTFDKIDEGTGPRVDLASALPAGVDHQNNALTDSGIDTDQEHVRSSSVYQEQSFFRSNWSHAQKVKKTPFNTFMLPSETANVEKSSENGTGPHQETKDFAAQPIQETQEDDDIQTETTSVESTTQPEIAETVEIENIQQEDQDQQEIVITNGILHSQAESDELVNDEIQIQTETSDAAEHGDHIAIDISQYVQPAVIQIETLDKEGTDAEVVENESQEKPIEPQEAEKGEIVAIDLAPVLEVTESEAVKIDETLNESVQHKKEKYFETVLRRRKTHAFEAIAADLYDEIETSQPSSESGEPTETKERPKGPGICRSCFDCCCLARNCSFNICNRDKDKPRVTVEREDIITPELVEGQRRGLRYLKRTICPLIRDSLRVFLVISELVFVLFGTIFSIATFSAGSNASFNIFHLVITLVSTVLAVIDFTYSFWSSCRKCVHTCNENVRKVQKTNGSNCTCSERCTNCYPCAQCKTYSDVLRAILSELLLVPLLICSIFEVVTGAPELNTEDAPSNILGLILFVIDCFGIVLFVYMGRIVILIGVILSVLGVLDRSKKETDDSSTSDDIEIEQTNGDLSSKDTKKSQETNDVEIETTYDPANKKFVIGFQLTFFTHVSLQMIAQIFMFIAIGGKVRYDNRHLYDQANTDDRIRSSPELIYMCVAATVLPLCGFLTFFVVTNFWVQEFPIAFLIDLVSILEAPGMEDFFEIKKITEERTKPMHQVLNELVKVDKIKSDYKTMKETATFKKLTSPFKSPGMVIVCALYLAAQFAFVITAATAHNEMNQLGIQVLNGGGWVVFYIIAVIVGIIANMYAFAVAGFWIMVVATVLAIIAFIVIMIVLVCLVGAGVSSNNSSN